MICSMSHLHRGATGHSFSCPVCHCMFTLSVVQWWITWVVNHVRHGSYGSWVKWVMGHVVIWVIIYVVMSTWVTDKLCNGLRGSWVK